MQRVLAAWALIAFLPSARASEARPHGAFFSVRATALAGAQTGLADDPSAAWYNPAGLARFERNLASLGATALQRVAVRADRFLGGPVDVTVSNAFSPSSVSTIEFGPGRLAFAALSPGDQGFRVDQRVRASSSDPSLVDGYSTRDRTDSRYYLGLAYGVAITPSIDLGASAFYVYRGFREFRADLRQYAAPRSDGAVAVQESSNESGVAHGALLGLGMLWQPGGRDGKWRAGMAARWGFDVASRSRIEEEAFVGHADAGAVNGVSYQRTAGSIKRARLGAAPGPSLGAGVAWRASESVTAAADVTAVGFAPVRETGVTLSTKPTLNASVGAEVALTSTYHLQGGIFTNRSSVTSVQGPLRPDLWDEYGVGLGGTRYGKHASAGAALRLAYVHARGASSALAQDAAQSLAADGYEASLVFGGSFYY